jgi:hypothetical protein
MENPPLSSHIMPDWRRGLAGINQVFSMDYSVPSPARHQTRLFILPA